MRKWQRVLEDFEYLERKPRLRSKVGIQFEEDMRMIFDVQIANTVDIFINLKAHCMIGITTKFIKLIKAFLWTLIKVGQASVWHILRWNY